MRVEIKGGGGEGVMRDGAGGEDEGRGWGLRESVAVVWCWWW